MQISVEDYLIDLLRSKAESKNIESFLLKNKDKKLNLIQLNEALVWAIRNKYNKKIINLLLEFGAEKKYLKTKIITAGLERFKKKYPNMFRGQPITCSKDLIILKEILKKLDNPQKKIPPVFHVTGSNGKGSVCSFLESILKENNYKVHRFTNPAVLRFSENVNVAGKELKNNDLYLALIKVKQIYDELLEDIDFVKKFEDSLINDKKINLILDIKNYTKIRDWVFLIPAILLIFSQNKADATIIEVITGGLRDYTNVFSEEEIFATIITYTQYGIGSNDGTMKVLNTKTNKWECSNKATAYHKAMLSKKNKPTIIANQTNNVLEEIRNTIKLNNSFGIEYNKDWFIENETENSFIFKGFGKKIKLDKPKHLLEKYQTINVATAIAAIFSQNKFIINTKTIQKAINKTIIYGRLQYLNKGNYFKYFQNFNKLITGFIKFNDNGIESINDILSHIKGNIFVIYTTNNQKTKGEHYKIFQIFKKYKNLNLIIYMCNKLAFNDMKEEALESGVKFIAKLTLSSAIIECNTLLKKSNDNTILILCNSMKNFDKNIILLN